MNLLDVSATTNSLNNIKEQISKVLTCSLNEIKDNPSKEKEMVYIWTKHIADIGDFLFLECERTGNKDVYKKLMKNIFFKKNKL